MNDTTPRKDAPEGPQAGTPGQQSGKAGGTAQADAAKTSSFSEKEIWEVALDVAMANPALHKKNFLKAVLKRLSRRAKKKAKKADAANGTPAPAGDAPITAPVLPNLTEDGLVALVRRHASGRVVLKGDSLWPRIAVSAENLETYLKRYGPRSWPQLAVIFSDGNSRERRRLVGLLKDFERVNVLARGRFGYKRTSVPFSRYLESRAHPGKGKNAKRSFGDVREDGGKARRDRTRKTAGERSDIRRRGAGRGHDDVPVRELFDLLDELEDLADRTPPPPGPLEREAERTCFDNIPLPCVCEGTFVVERGRGYVLVDDAPDSALVVSLSTRKHPLLLPGDRVRCTLRVIDRANAPEDWVNFMMEQPCVVNEMGWDTQEESPTFRGWLIDDPDFSFDECLLSDPPQLDEDFKLPVKAFVEEVVAFSITPFRARFDPPDRRKQGKKGAKKPGGPLVLKGSPVPAEAFATSRQHLYDRLRLRLEPDARGGGVVVPDTDALLLVSPMGREGGCLDVRLAKGASFPTAIGEQETLVKINHQVPSAFPRAAQDEADHLSGGIPDADRRKDLRGLPLVTLDGADARDFDDAICVERRGDGYRLTVAIADVTLYVRHDDPLDKEARARGNSFYFPTSVEPMLPFALSHGLCSLVPHEDRPVLHVTLDYDARGRRTGFEAGAGVMRSLARLTYEGAWAMVAGEKDGDAPAERSGCPNGSECSDTGAGADTRRVTDMLTVALELAARLKGRRLEAGALDLDLPEPKATFNADGTLATLTRARRLDTHRLVEEFMIAANEAVAEFLKEKGLPFPSRVHPAPSPEKLETLFRDPIVSALCGRRLKRFDLQGLLDACRGRPEAPLIRRRVVRSLALARYDENPEGHYGLALDAYCHFTSPIRRYADILVHRALKRAIGFDTDVVPAGMRLARLCDEINHRERAATECEREMDRRLSVLWARQQKRGTTWTARVTEVGRDRLFVELEDVPVSGMVAAFKTGGYVATHYDGHSDTWFAREGKKRYDAGARVRVALLRTDPVRLYVDFALLAFLNG